MSDDWVTSLTPENNEETFSIANTPAQKPQEETSSIADVPQNKEEITGLGSSYQIKDVTASKKSTGSDGGMSTLMKVLIAAAVLVPFSALLIFSSISKQKAQEEEKAFLFGTIESKYFTLNYGAEYSIRSAIDQKIPFLEKHTLTSTGDAQKRMEIIVKDVRFGYQLDDNSNVKARRATKDIYTEEKFELDSKDGYYYKKIDENFEHFVVLIDRQRSLLYEISFTSTTSLATNPQLESEFKGLLNSMTFL